MVLGTWSGYDRSIDKALIGENNMGRSGGSRGFRSARQPSKNEMIIQEIEAIKQVLEGVVQRQIEADQRLTFMLVKQGYARIAACDKCEAVVCQAIVEGVVDDNDCPSCGEQLTPVENQEEE